MSVKEMLDKTLHISTADVPWVTIGEGIRLRLLHARPEEDFIVQHIEAMPFAKTPLHRHTGPVFGFTLKGAWGHDESYGYEPGTYIYETPGVVHRFLNGPGVTEAVFVVHGPVEHVDPVSGEVVSRATAGSFVEAYLALCAKEGHPRPTLLG